MAKIFVLTRETNVKNVDRETFLVKAFTDEEKAKVAFNELVGEVEKEFIAKRDAEDCTMELSDGHMIIDYNNFDEWDEVMIRDLELD